MKTTMTLKGRPELEKELKRQSAKTGRNGPVPQEIYNTALIVQRQAKHNIQALGAIDKGHLLQSMLAETAPDGLSAEVGATAPYAPYVEYGTVHRTKMPPPDALETWARAHGFDSAWPVCQAILARGGLAARPYLLPAYYAEEKNFFERLARIMEA
jgi:hypothetical protein